MGDIKFDFVYLPDKTSVLDNKIVKESLIKWSMDGNIKVKYYNFNQPFKVQEAQDFVRAFFKSPVVCSTLEVCNDSSWRILFDTCDDVKVETVPCSVTSMAFFDKIINPENKIVRSDKGDIIMKQEVQVGIFYSNDNLRASLLEEDSVFYRLYELYERKEFIFKLLTHFALGGSLCQFEDNIKPYLDTVKKVYKEFVAVTKDTDREEIRVRSLVLKVIAYIDNQPICPSDPDNLQNFVYFIVDSYKRQLTVLMHQYID